MQSTCFHTKHMYLFHLKNIQKIRRVVSWIYKNGLETDLQGLKMARNGSGIYLLVFRRSNTNILLRALI